MERIKHMVAILLLGLALLDGVDACIAQLPAKLQQLTCSSTQALHHHHHDEVVTTAPLEPAAPTAQPATPAVAASEGSTSSYPAPIWQPPQLA